MLPLRTMQAQCRIAFSSANHSNVGSEPPHPKTLHGSYGATMVSSYARECRAVTATPFPAQWNEVERRAGAGGCRAGRPCCLPAESGFVDRLQCWVPTFVIARLAQVCCRGQRTKCVLLDEWAPLQIVAQRCWRATRAVQSGPRDLSLVSEVLRKPSTTSGTRIISNRAATKMAMKDQTSRTMSRSWDARQSAHHEEQHPVGRRDKPDHDVHDNDDPEMHESIRGRAPLAGRAARARAASSWRQTGSQEPGRAG